MNSPVRERIVYIFGAGASHACVKAVGSPHGILMDDLGPELRSRVHDLAEASPDEANLVALVNSVVGETTNFEHIITFLDESASVHHKQFAADLRGAFVEILRARLTKISADHGGPPVGLYEALLDMHLVSGCAERLAGMITLNYDEYIETAVASILGGPVDYGLAVTGMGSESRPVRLLKLHGSFGWKYSWPIQLDAHAEPLWIPPGLQKSKDHYPFNILWGSARELLDCDVVRIIGCQLGPNDWDLISLLFTTRHTNAKGGRFRIEVINSPTVAEELQKNLPYLEALSILEVNPVGPALVAEHSDGRVRKFRTLEAAERERVKESLGEGQNWFRLWLKLMAEDMYSELGNVHTQRGVFEALLEE